MSKQENEDKKIKKNSEEVFVYKKEKFCSAPHCQDPQQDG